MRARAVLPALTAGVLAVLSPSMANAQFRGAVSLAGPTISLSGVGSSAALGAHFEHAVSDRFGWGLFASYWSFGEEYGGGSLSYKYVALGGTGAYHFEVDNEKIDPFVGAAIGYYVVNFSGTDDLSDLDARSSHLFAGGFGGVRYFVKPNMALVGRAGFGETHLSVGLEFKF